MNKRTQKSNAKSNTFFGGAAILAASIAVVKVIGALYKIPLGRILGDVGFGHFNNAYAIYNLLLMVSTAGLPVAMSKTISEANALNRRNQVSRVFHVALVTFIILGSISSLIMFLFAQPLANLQGDSLAAPAVRVMALSCFFVCTMSAYRGYAQGHSDMVPTAVSQVLEAMTKLIVGLFLAWYLLRLGFGSEFSAAGAIAGVTAGTILSLVYMAANYLRHRPALQSGERCASGRAIVRRLLALAIPITIASSMVSIITLIDTSLVQGQLQNALGYSLDETRALYGNYSACMDLYNLPSSLMVALTASVIPAVSASITQHNEKQTARIVRSSFRVTALLAFPMGLGLWSLSGPIFRLFYPRYDGALGGQLLSVLGIASIFVCLMLITNSILQSYGRVNVPIFTMLIGGVVKIVLNYNLTAVPSINIHGAPIGTLVCFALTAILNLIAVSRVAAFHLNYPGYFLRPLLASLAMAFSARSVYALCAHFLLSEDSGRTIMLVCVGAAIAVAVVVYAVLVLALRIVTRDDLALLPKGEKLARILHVR